MLNWFSSDLRIIGLFLTIIKIRSNLLAPLESESFLDILQMAKLPGTYSDIQKQMGSQTFIPNVSGNSNLKTYICIIGERVYGV